MNPAPLVLLHGYPFDHTMWERVIVALGKGLKTIAPDLRGFGNTPTGSEEPSLDVMAEDVARLLDRSNFPRAVLAGFSLGGYVALAFAERHRPRLAGLALINSTVLADTEEARAGRRAMIEKVRAEGPQAAAEGAIPKMVTRGDAASAGSNRGLRKIRGAPADHPHPGRQIYPGGTCPRSGPTQPEGGLRGNPQRRTCLAAGSA